MTTLSKRVAAAYLAGRTSIGAGPGGYTVTYSLPWDNSAGDGMTVNDPEYGELSAWTEELSSALAAAGLSAEFEPEAMHVFLSTAEEVAAAITTIEGKLHEAEGDPRAVVKNNASKSELMSVSRP